jgi:hypothetical protein
MDEHTAPDIMNEPIDERELAIVALLDRLLRDSAVRAAIDPVALHVMATLTADPTALLAWEPLPLSIYGAKLPASIQSSWVFVLRGNSASGAERHPNSHQRVVSYRGAGDLQIRIGDDWQSHLLTDDPHAQLLQRWASVPINAWHQAVVPDAHWVVVSFHTAADHELIEERPDSPNSNSMRQRRYL